jgi:UDP-N-acetylmuramyl tripeptide synthase
LKEREPEEIEQKSEEIEKEELFQEIEEPKEQEGKKNIFVAILGRGNEKWLLYNKEKIPFDDREVVQELLNSIKLE